MTNLIQDFQDYQEQGIENIINNLGEKEREIKERKHMLRVHYACTSLNNNEFTKYDIKFILIEKFYDHDVGNIIKFKLLNNEKNTVLKYNSYGGHIAPYETTKKLLNFSFDEDLVDSKFKDIKILIPLTKNGIEEFKNLLLSDKLKAELNYAILETRLEDKVVDNKKMKI